MIIREEGAFAEQDSGAKTLSQPLDIFQFSGTLNYARPLCVQILGIFQNIYGRIAGHDSFRRDSSVRIYAAKRLADVPTSYVVGMGKTAGPA